MNEAPKILITGNMGYVGPVLVRALRARFPKALLVGYDAGFFAHSLTAPARGPETFLDEQIFGDVRDMTPETLKGVNAVVHLAAVSNDPMGNRFEDVTAAINHKASVRIAEMARDQGVEAFVFASSCSAYGFAEGGPRKETDDLNPLTAYARSKVGTETDLKSMRLNSMKATALRFATACGMSDRLRLDLVLNDFVAGAMSEGKITVLSDGSPWRPLIDVKDMARAIEWAITREPEQGGQFLSINAGIDEANYQVRELAETVAAEVPGAQVSINPNAQPDKRSYRVDFGLYRQLAPQHQPQQKLRDSIRGIRDGLQAIGYTGAASPLIRLKTLDRHMTSGAMGEDLRWAKFGA